jgi:hypothetical protein
MKKTFVTLVFAIAAWGALTLLTPPALSIDCSLVRCPACPDGYVFKPTGHNCCRCVPAH